MCLIATEFPVVHLEWTRIGDGGGGRKSSTGEKLNTAQRALNRSIG